MVETAPPLPERNPVVASTTAKSKMALPADANPVVAADTTIVETAPPLPERNPIVASTTVKAPSAQALVRPPTPPKITIPDHVKPGRKTPKRPEVVQQPIHMKPKSSTADVLAGGL